MVDRSFRLWIPNVQLFVTAVALLSLLAVGTVIYHEIEGWTWSTSFYFTVCTLTTIGYGDVVPTTDSSRLFTAFFALAGVSIALASFGIIGASYLRRGQEMLERMGSVR
jgi:hypothetical protein